MRCALHDRFVFETVVSRYFCNALRAAHHGRPRLSETIHGVEVHPSTVLEPSERRVGQPVAYPVPVHGNGVARSQVANETNTSERATHHFESFCTETQA
jgi:hypothetical protein